MTTIEIQAALAEKPTEPKMKRKITAVGWVLVKPAAQANSGLIQGLSVLGSLVIEEEEYQLAEVNCG